MFAAKFSNTFLHIPFYHLLPRLDLTEGMAVAAAFASYPLCPHEWAAGMQITTKPFDPQRYSNFLDFAFSAPTKAYTIEGSFMRYIHDTLGPKALIKVYKHGTYHVLGRQLQKTIKNWHSFLSTIHIQHYFLIQAHQIAHSKGVLGKNCINWSSRVIQRISNALKHHKYKKAQGLIHSLLKANKSPYLVALYHFLDALQGKDMDL